MMVNCIIWTYPVLVEDYQRVDACFSKYLEELTSAKVIIIIIIITVFIVLMQADHDAYGIIWDYVYASLAKFRGSVPGTLHTGSSEPPTTTVLSTSHRLPQTSPASSSSILFFTTVSIPNFQSNNILLLVLVVGVVINLIIVSGILIICVVLVFHNCRRGPLHSRTNVIQPQNQGMHGMVYSDLHWTVITCMIASHCLYRCCYDSTTKHAEKPSLHSAWSNRGSTNF